MNNEQPGYYAIIPASVRYDKNLKANEKLLYGEITCLANAKGYCYAGNAYFANLYDVDKTTVSRWVSNLEKCGYIKTQLIKRDDNQIVERRIYIAESIPIDEKINTPIDENAKPPIDEKSKENITRENNTSLNSFGATTPKPRKRTKAPLIDREPVNDLERIEKAYLENYRELFKKGIVYTEKPVINWAQSRRLVNNSIARFGYNTIMDAVQKSINNDFCVQKGYTLTTILSSGVLAGLINGNSWKQSVRAIDKVDHPDDMGEILF